MSETESYGKVVNATTKDLLDIDADLLSFDAACVTNIEIKIKNIADVEIPIKLDEKKLQLSPGELFSEVVTRKVSCEAEQVNFHLIGFNSFIDEIIIVSFDPPPT
ncbi:hypothetical protein [Virgibacillus salexigens]|uniref:hypothetical protein n=1 Tax=Virgibacillus salexigens TaxID=61016 RepID=UPI00190C16DB|nr:hypothetical protein [Virgibacillus salexigens]